MLLLMILGLEGAEALISQNTISVRVCYHLSAQETIYFPFNRHSYQL